MIYQNPAWPFSKAFALWLKPCLLSDLAFCVYLIAIRLVLRFEVKVSVSRAQKHFTKDVRQSARSNESDRSIPDLYPVFVIVASQKSLQVIPPPPSRRTVL